MERKFRPTLSTKPARNLSTGTFFNSLKHVLRTPAQPSFDMFLSWLRRFEFRAKNRIKNQSICLNFGKSQKHQKEKRKVDSCRRISSLETGFCAFRELQLVTSKIPSIVDKYTAAHV
jgi:hypothetical protein